MRLGLPTEVAQIIEADVLAALKHLAALDPTVTSGGPVATTTTTTTTATSLLGTIETVAEGLIA
jgi:hypothetical protein